MESMVPQERKQEPDRRTEFLLHLNADRIKGLEGALEKNWLAHLILAGVGLALVFNIGNLPAFLEEYFMKGKYDEKAVATIILAVLLFYFMKLGHLLTTFVSASRLQASLLSEFLADQFDEQKLIPLSKTTNLFIEAFYSFQSFRAFIALLPYLGPATVVVSAAQSAALFLMSRAYGIYRWLPFQMFLCGATFVIFYIRQDRARHAGRHLLRYAMWFLAALAIAATVFLAAAGFRASGWPPVFLLGSTAILMTLYSLFWASQKESATGLVVLSTFLTAAWLAMFAGAAP